MQSDKPDFVPTDIRQADATHLAIQWSDGLESRIEVRALRLACCCANCIDEWSGEKRLDPASVAEDVRPQTIAPVGRYGLRIDWSDGHSTGIYTFRRLRELATSA